MTSFQSSRIKVERRGFTAPAKPLRPLPALPRTLMRDVDVDLVLSAGDKPLPPPPPPQREPAARERPATAGQRRARGPRGGVGGVGADGAPPCDGNNKQSRERFLALSLINARVDTILEGYEDAPGSPGGTAGGGGGGSGGGGGGGSGGTGSSGSPTTQLEPLSLRTHTQGQYASQAEQSQDLLQGLLRRVGIVEGKVSATRLGYTLEHMFEELRQGLAELGETAAEGLRSRETSLEEIAELRRRVDVLQEKEARAAREAEDAPKARPATSVTLAHAEVRGRGLWTRNPELMREACAVFVAVCRQLAEEHGGVEVLCEGDTVAMAFQSPADGAAWALGLQRGLLAAAWPAELSDANSLHPGCGVVRDKDGRLMWRGLRVGTGMHQGQTGTGGVGPLASVCAKLAARARGGETLVHAAVHQALQELRIPDAFSAPAHPSAKAVAAFCYAPEELRDRVYKENALDRDSATLEMWKADRERKMQVKQDAIDKAETDLAAAAKPTCFVSIGVSAVAHVTLEHCVSLWKLDPERASDVLQTCKEKVEELCTGHSGRLLRGEYDRFLLLFDRVDVALLFGTELHRMLTTVNIVWAKACDAAEEPAEADAAVATAAAPDEMLCSVVVTECKTVRQTADCLSHADIALLADAAAARRGGDTLVTQAALESGTRGRLSHIAVEPLCTTPAGHKLHLAYATEDGAAHRERLAAQPCLGPFQGLRGYLSDLKQRLVHERRALADAAAAAAATVSPKGKKKPVGGVPPAGDVWLTHAAIQNCTGLWAHDLPAMEAARRLTTYRLRRAAEVHGGYEVSSGCAYLAAFPSVEAALAFAVRAQCELLEEAWPAGILSHADARPAKAEGRLVWAGPRVRMCISGGVGVRAEENPATGRMEYYGAPVSTGEKLVRVTHGGLIAVPAEHFECLGESARATVVVAAEKAAAVAGVARPVALRCVVPRALAAREFPGDTPEEEGLESRVQRAVLQLTEDVAAPPLPAAAPGKAPTARSVEVPFGSLTRALPSELPRPAVSPAQQQQQQQMPSPHSGQEKQRLASLETSPSPSPRTSITWVGDPRRPSKTGTTSPASGDGRCSDPLDESRRSSGASEAESEDADMPDAVGQGAMATVEQWSRMMLVRAEANRLDDDELHTSLEKMEALEDVFSKVRTADCVVRRLKQKTPRSTRSRRDRAPERREKLERGATERMAEDEESRDSTPEERLETMRRRLVNMHKMTRVFYVQTAQYFAGMSGNLDMERITEDEFMIRWLKLLRRMDKDEGSEQKKVGQGTTRSAFTETMKFAVDMEAEEERHCSLGNYGVLYRSCPSLFCKTFNAMRTYFKQAGKGMRGGMGGGMADVARRSVTVRAGHQALNSGNHMAKRTSRVPISEPKGGAGSDLPGS